MVDRIPMDIIRTVHTIVILIAKVNQMWFYYVIINNVVVAEQKAILERVIKAVYICSAGLRVLNSKHIQDNKLNRYQMLERRSLCMKG